MRYVAIEFPTGKPGEKQLLRVKFDHNALADLEEYAQASIATLIQKDMNFAAIRMLLKFGLQWQPQFRGLTMQRAGELVQLWIDDGREIGELYEHLLDALKKSGLFKFDEPKEDEQPDASGGDANPRQPA